MSATDFKASLLNAAWRRYATVKVESLGGLVELDIRIPPANVLRELLRDMKGAKDQGEEQGLDLICRIVSACVWQPGALTSLFTPEEAMRWPYLSAVQGQCFEAIRAASSVEAAQGNSEATRT